ncbi:MAG: tetratricopeptide repeat protein [Flavobacterium sp.]
MKVKYAIAASVLLSLSAFAQKDELKALKKLDDKETQPTAADIAEYKRLLTEVEGKLGSATDEQKIDYHYYKGNYAGAEMAMNMANPAKAQAAFMDMVSSYDKVREMEKSKSKKKYTPEIETSYAMLKEQMLLPMAQQAAKQKNFKQAGSMFYGIYMLDKNDKSNLYNAAAMAVNAQDYDNALTYYLELDKAGYTGEGTVYSAKNIQTQQVEGFPNEALMRSAVLTKKYSDPKIEKMPSLKGEIVKNIALIYIQKGETEKAKQAMDAARKNNPDDVSLIISEADLYLKTKDMATYKKLITEATQKNPNNADLYYNLGVVSAETDKAEAKKFYEKALSINPNYTNANINLGAMMLEGEEKIVNEMNNPKTSDKRYNELKKQRDDLYKKALSYFEKAHKADPANEYVISAMANIYQGLDMENEAKAMRAKLKK